MKIRIYYEDTDAQGIVYHANYLKFCERARSESFFKAGLDIFSPQSYFVITAMNIKFHSPARLGDEIEIKTAILNIKPASISLKQEIYRLDELLFSAEVKAAHMSYSKPAKIDKQALEIFKSMS